MTATATMPAQNSQASQDAREATVESPSGYPTRYNPDGSVRQPLVAVTGLWVRGGRTTEYASGTIRPPLADNDPRAARRPPIDPTIRKALELLDGHRIVMFPNPSKVPGSNQPDANLHLDLSRRAEGEVFDPNNPPPRGVLHPVTGIWTRPTNSGGEYSSGNVRQPLAGGKLPHNVSQALNILAGMRLVILDNTRGRESNAPERVLYVDPNPRMPRGTFQRRGQAQGEPGERPDAQRDANEPTYTPTQDAGYQADVDIPF